MRYVQSFLIVSILQGMISISASVQDHPAFERVKNGCKSKIDFRTIDEFNEFMSLFRLLDTNERSIIQIDSTLKRCFDDRDSLYALEELVSNYDKERPCKFQQVAKLENFARSYLLANKKSLALKFFTLFGVNIGYHCKRNLLANLRQADSEVDQVDFIYSMASPSGWSPLINDHTMKSMKFGTSSYAEANVINRIAKLIPGFTSVNQLEYMDFDHPFNEIPPTITNGVETSTYKFKNPSTAKDLNERLKKIIQSCQNLDQFYLNLVLSLSRLNGLGLLIDVKIIDELHERSVTLHKWLSAASFCQLMIRVRTELDGDTIKIDIVHNDSLIVSRRKLYSYVAEFEDISNEVVGRAWRASIFEGSWCQKSQAMFNPNDNQTTSSAMNQMEQFIKGIERDYGDGQNGMSSHISELK